MELAIPLGWYSVRMIFEHSPGGYEERVTLWRAHSPERAIERAVGEANDYCRDTGAIYCGLAQSFQLFDEPHDGAEVFSLIRESDLGAADYLDGFFDTGTERQRVISGAQVTTSLPNAPMEDFPVERVTGIEPA